MIFSLMLLLIPISLVLEYVLHAPPVWIFLTSVLAIVPLAEWIRKSTEQLANRVGSAIGGLLNVTFGNVAELILALFVLYGGHANVVKAQITGAIIGNSLLGLGLAIVVGSFGRSEQKFNRATAGRLSSLLLLCVVALMVPALFDITEFRVSGAAHAAIQDERLSLGVAVVLIVIYIANLVYSLVTHRDTFAAFDETPVAETSNDALSAAHASSSKHEVWAMWKILAVLIGATLITALEAEMVSGALEATSAKLGVTTFFLGITVLAVVGNAAEYVSAVYFARKDRMDLVIGITVGSTIQIALFVAPLLVLVSFFMGKPMNLVFSNPLELISVAAVAFIVNAIAQDGETTWFEGLLLLGVYVLLSMAFFFFTPPV
jgi:Ca2+:H+ antiporter